MSAGNWLTLTYINDRHPSSPVTLPISEVAHGKIKVWAGLGVRGSGKHKQTQKSMSHRELDPQSPTSIFCLNHDLYDYPDFTTQLTIVLQILQVYHIVGQICCADINIVAAHIPNKTTNFLISNYF